MSIEHIEHHLHEAIVSLVPPLWGKPVVAAILRSYIRRVQELEDDCIAVLSAYDVNTCDATRLAVLGRIVGQSDLGWDLETYRAIVRARIATNRSHGREDDIINVLRLITGSTEPVEITTYSPATMTVTPAEHVDAEHMLAVVFLLRRARAAGVQLHFLNPPPDAPSTPGLTFASAVTGGGGELASAVTGGGDGAYSARIL